MKASILFAATALIFAFAPKAIFAETVMKPVAEERDLIQIAMLLDASNSMDGLIGQAKSQLWKIVNELGLAKRNGRTPRLEVAFYEYGKSSLAQGEGYIRKIVPLSTDLDVIADELFKLTTNGGDEYCGAVIGRAVRDLEWSSDPRVMKAIFIAGNEPFTQGPLDYRKAVKEAVSRGIAVHTIFCGNAQEGIATSWKEGADAGGGSYVSIDQDKSIVHVKAPQDSLIMALGTQLNATYVGFGRSGAMRKGMQAEQDSRAVMMAPGAAVERSVAKAGCGYANSGWDLVDAAKEKKADVASMAEAELPAEMKSLNPAARQAYLEKKAAERAKIQTRISQLNDERRAYIAAREKESGENNSLDKAITTTVRKQAAAKGYTFSSK